MLSAVAVARIRWICTSRSRTGPSWLANHFSSSFRLLSSGGRISLNRRSAARMRRVATRIWWTWYGSVPARAPGACCMNSAAFRCRTRTARSPVAVGTAVVSDKRPSVHHLFTSSTPAVNAGWRAGAYMLAAMAPALLDAPRLTLALVEAQVGSLVDVLPVALLVASPTGEILRANAAAVELLDNAALVGQSVTDALEVAERESLLKVCVRWLRHEDEVLTLYVIHDAED